MAKVVKYTITKDNTSIGLMINNSKKEEAQIYLNQLTERKQKNGYQLVKKNKNSLIFSKIIDTKGNIAFVLFKIVETKTVNLNPKEVSELRKKLV